MRDVRQPMCRSVRAEADRRVDERHVYAKVGDAEGCRAPKESARARGLRPRRRSRTIDPGHRRATLRPHDTHAMRNIAKHPIAARLLGTKGERRGMKYTTV